MSYTQLTSRLREIASKGVSVWGDLQVEAAKEIEILTAERDALQARVAELENLTAAQQASNLKLVAALNEAKPSPTALELMREYSNGKQWALEEAAKICDSTPPPPFRPSIEAAWAIRKLGEGL